MSDLEARQARPATPPMTKHYGPVIPPGREMQPKPVQKETKAMQKEAPPLSQNARMVLSQLDHNGPQTGVELSKATGLSQGSVSTALKALRAAGEVTSKKAGLNGGAIINTSTAWATKEVEVEVTRRKDDERFDEKRADRIGREGNIGYPDTENDLEDDEPCDVRTATTSRRIRTDGVGPQNLKEYQAQFQSPAGNDPEKPGGSAIQEEINVARVSLKTIERCLGRMARANATSIQPLPADDYRIEAMRRLVPLVSDDIGEAINDLIEHVTGKEAA